VAWGRFFKKRSHQSLDGFDLVFGNGCALNHSAKGMSFRLALHDK
jgi:hypothetical protein